MTESRWAPATADMGGGRRLMSPLHGFGKMWQKTYRARIPAHRAAPADVIAEWKLRFQDFWPEGNRFSAPLTGIAPGEVAAIDMALPGRMRLSTGVLVLYADEESFTLMTPQGHMFAGWITFSAAQEGLDTLIQAQVLMRASDPFTEIGLTLGGHRQEDRFWVDTLTNVSAHFGHAGEVATELVCVDKRRQWARWRNVRQSPAMRVRPRGRS